MHRQQMPQRDFIVQKCCRECHPTLLAQPIESLAGVIWCDTVRVGLIGNRRPVAVGPEQVALFEREAGAGPKEPDLASGAINVLGENVDGKGKPWRKA